MVQKDTSIIDSIPDDWITNFKHFRDRYYEYRYCTTFPKIGDFDTTVRIHTNRILLISLARGNKLVKQNDKISEISFEINGNLNRSVNKLSGKGKRGAQKLDPTSILCYIKSEDGSSHPVYSGICGKLVEVNENLLDNPQLSVTDLDDMGYIAIVIPDLKKWDVIEKNLLTAQQYQEYLKGKP